MVDVQTRFLSKFDILSIPSQTFITDSENYLFETFRPGDELFLFG